MTSYYAYFVYCIVLSYEITVFNLVCFDHIYECLIIFVLFKNHH